MIILLNKTKIAIVDISFSQFILNQYADILGDKICQQIIQLKYQYLKMYFNELNIVKTTKCIYTLFVTLKLICYPSKIGYNIQVKIMRNYLRKSQTFQ